MTRSRAATLAVGLLVAALASLGLATSGQAATTHKTMLAGAVWTVACPNALTVSGQSAQALTLSCAAGGTTTTTGATTTMPATTTTVPQTTTTVGSSCTGQQVTPATNLQGAINAAPAGTTFCLANGTYSTGGIAPKNGDTIRGASRDGVVFDGGNSRANAFTGTASSVTITQLTVQHYAPARLFGAVDAVNATGWTLTHLHVTLNNEEGLALGPGDLVDTVLADHNGNVGVGSGNAYQGGNQPFPNLTFTVQNSELAYNGNQDPTDAAGAKVLFTTNAVFSNDYVHDNNGPGLWADGWTTGTQFTNNRVVNNSGGGIFEEISTFGTISGNTVTGNAAGGSCGGTTTLYFCGTNGISVSSSHDVTVSGNTLSGNYSEVAAYNGHSDVALYNIIVTGNTMSGGTTGIQTVPAQPNAYATSHWANNTYPVSQQYWWTQGQIGLAQWTADGQS